MRKVAIVGTVGIPAKYGGFETLAENITSLLNQKVSFSIFCSSKNISLKLKQYNQASLFYLPLSANGIQSIPYDVISLFWAAFKSNTILVLGVSGCISLPLFRLFYPRKRLIINIDGLEHKREKWSSLVQKFLKYSEKLAVKYADEIIADNAAIQVYLKNEYNMNSHLIAYGGDHSSRKKLTRDIKDAYNLPDKYAFKVCRIEPENNIHLVLKAFSLTATNIVLIGNWNSSKYGKSLKKKYASFTNLILLDPIYDQLILDQIRSNCFIYIHGHKAGGTNPSLVEAMSIGLPIIACDVSYNRETTFNQSLYFTNFIELATIIDNITEPELLSIGGKMKKIADLNYKWGRIVDQYYSLF